MQATERQKITHFMILHITMGCDVTMQSAGVHWSSLDRNFRRKRVKHSGDLKELVSRRGLEENNLDFFTYFFG